MSDATWMTDVSDRNWRLGDDLHPSDNLLDSVTFDDLILAVRCSCPTINRAAVYQKLAEILSQRDEDMYFLVKRNMDKILEEARKGRFS